MSQYNAGEFKHTIVIKESTSSVNSNGFDVATETTVLTTKAKIENTNGSRFFGANKDDVKNTSKFIIRYRNILNEKDWSKLKVVYGSKSYLVQYINNIDESNQYQEIVGEAI